jgi:pimeloyl-ACP methyl ester carboxylesterase
MKTPHIPQMPELKKAAIAGITFNYYEAGQGVPLILLHGWRQTSYIWRKVLPALQEHYRVIAIDLPGMGNSDISPTADTQTVARLIKSFCDHFDLPEVHLIAHDVGAWVAVTFALEYEKSLLSLIVLDAGIPGLIPDETFSPMNAQKIWQFYFHAITGMPEFLIAGKEKEYLSWYFTKKTTVKDAISEEDMAVYVDAYTGKERLRNGFDYYRAFPESANQNKSYQHKLHIPILAIGGDDAQGLNMGRAMQKIAGKEIQSVSIPGCGHYIVEEHPGKFLTLALEFLAPGLKQPS